MSVRLTVRQRSEAGGADKPTVVLLDDPVITLGRDVSCQVVLAQHAVSRSHARISSDGAIYFVEDLGSSYGTHLNGERLKKAEKRPLRNGDTIAIAQFDIVFDRVADSNSPNKSQDTQFVARKVVKDVMRGLTAGADKPYFRVMNGPRDGERIEISDAQEYIIGRDDSADIIFDDDLVSRRHVKVRRDWSGTHVEDLGSRNGIKINKKRTPKKTLKDRDELEVGGVKLLYIDPTEVREAPLVLPTKEENEPTIAPNPEPEGEAPGPQAEAAANEGDGGGEPEADQDAEAAAENEAAPEGDDEAPPDEGEAPEGDEAPNDEEGASEEDENYDAGDEGDEGDGGASDDAPAGPLARFGIDLSNKQTLIGLGLAGVITLIVLVTVILVLAGA